MKMVSDHVCNDCRISCVDCPGGDAPEAARLRYQRDILASRLREVNAKLRTLDRKEEEK